MYNSNQHLRDAGRDLATSKALNFLQRAEGVKAERQVGMGRKIYMYVIVYTEQFWNEIPIVLILLKMKKSQL